MTHPPEEEALTAPELALPELVVVVPSRGRPGRISTLLEAARATMTARTRFVFALDAGDPTTADSIDAAFSVPDDSDHRSAGIVADEFPDAGLVLLSRSDDDPFVTVGANDGSAQALNRTVLFFAWMSSATAVAYLSDCAVPRTPGWDTKLLEALKTSAGGFAHPNHLHRDQTRPASIAASTDVVRALGFLVPPGLGHLHHDDVWQLWAVAARRCTYLPDVVIEHVHPLSGQGEWTEDYARAHSPERVQHDLGAFRTYVLEGLSSDVRTLRAALSVTPS